MGKFFIVPLSILFLLFSCQTPPGSRVETREEIKKKEQIIKTPESEREHPPEVSIEKEKPQPKEGEFPMKRKIPEISSIMVEKYLNRMTIEEKIGQLFITWVKGKFINREIEKIISDGHVGGIILNKYNIVSRDQLSAFISRMQEIAYENNPPMGLFIGVDQEGGRVERLKFPEFTRFPAPYYWGEHDDPYFVEAVAYITGKELAGIGCNMNFAPVLDLYGKPDSSIIGDRSMGNNMEKVSRFGIFYLFGAREAGIIPVIKHFPGHGVTRVDSHKRLPEVDISEDVLMKREIIPFKRAIDFGAEAVMTAHILYKRIDPEYPVTMSKRIIKGILREKLGFKGVVISDAIDMGALTDNNSIDKIISQSLLAGVDIILINSKYDVIKLEQLVLDMYRKRVISKEIIDESVRRIIALKLKHNLVGGNSYE